MKRIIIVILLALASTAFAQETKYYNENLDGMKQIREAVTLAKQTDRYVLCQVGGNWCPWCIRFAQFAYSDTLVAPLIERNYVYIHLNTSRNNKNEEALRFLGNPGRFGYPVFVIIDKEGKPIHIQESESLELGKGYDPKKVAKFLSLWTEQAIRELK